MPPPSDGFRLPVAPPPPLVPRVVLVGRGVPPRFPPLFRPIPWLAAVPAAPGVIPPLLLGGVDSPRGPRHPRSGRAPAPFASPGSPGRGCGTGGMGWCRCDDELAAGRGIRFCAGRCGIAAGTPAATAGRPAVGPILFAPCFGGSHSLRALLQEDEEQTMHPLHRCCLHCSTMESFDSLESLEAVSASCSLRRRYPGGGWLGGFGRHPASCLAWYMAERTNERTARER